jgi:hypothetical protein
MVKRLLMAVPPKDHNGVEFPYVDVRIWELKDFDPTTISDSYDNQTGIFNIRWTTTFAISYYRIADGEFYLLLNENLEPKIDFFYAPKYVNLTFGTQAEEIYFLFLLIKVMGVIYGVNALSYSIFGESRLTSLEWTMELSGDRSLDPPDLVAIYLKSQSQNFAGLTVVDV